jgi:O-antigen/teichoic acid export membrane protein
MIGKMVGNEEAAFYSVAYSVAYVLSILQASIEQVLIPWKYQKMEEKNYKEIGTISIYMICFIGVISLAYILIAPEVMKILFTKDYSEAVWCIPPITASIYFIYLGSLFVNIESYYEKTRYIMVISIICSMVNIVLNYALIGKCGYIICGYTTLFSYIVFTVGHYALMRKVCRERIPDVKIFNIPLMSFISCIVLLGTFLFTALYNYPVYRYLLLTAICVIMFLCRNIVISIIKKIRE